MMQFQVRIFWNLILTYEDGYTLAVLECDGIESSPISPKSQLLDESDKSRGIHIGCLDFALLGRAS